MTRSALYQVHKERAAAFGEYFGWELPCRYSSSEREYNAARERAAVIDRSYIGRLEMRGEDDLDLLNRLSTNEIGELPEGNGLTTVLTSSKGRVVDHLTLYYRPDHRLLLTGPRHRDTVISWLDQFTFGEEVELKDVTESTAMLTLLGPQARVILEAFGVQGLGGLEPHHGVSASVQDIAVYIALENPLWGQSYNLIIDADDAPRVWEALLEKGRDLGLEPLGTDAYEALRIEAGVPASGAELSEEVNPLEAGLGSSVSFTKGCYVGQEVVARLNTYDKVKRHLVKMQFETAPDPGSALELDGKKVGTLTSAASIPGDGRVVALGYVAKAHSRPGVKVISATSSGQSLGEIVGLAGH